MCDPVSLTIAAIAVAGASAGLTYVGQAQAARAQSAMQGQNAATAIQSYRLQQSELQNQLLQQRSQTEQQDVQQTIAAEQARASERVSAAEGGLSGVSLSSILTQTNREQALNRAVSGRNYQTLQQEETNKEGQAYFDMQNRVNSVPGGIFPSLAAPILQTAGAGLNAYASYIYKPGK
jgi:hypothetical protein